MKKKVLLILHSSPEMRVESMVAYNCYLDLSEFCRSFRASSEDMIAISTMCNQNADSGNNLCFSTPVIKSIFNLLFWPEAGGQLVQNVFTRSFLKLNNPKQRQCQLPLKQCTITSSNTGEVTSEHVPSPNLMILRLIFSNWVIVSPHFNSKAPMMPLYSLNFKAYCLPQPFKCLTFPFLSTYSHDYMVEGPFGKGPVKCNIFSSRGLANISMFQS